MSKRLLIAAGLVLLAACSGSATDSDAIGPSTTEAPTTRSSADTIAASTSTTVVPLAQADGAVPPPTAAPSTPSTRPAPATTTITTVATTTTAPPTFTSNIEPVDAETLGSSWREGCPVGLDDLRLLTLAHWNFDGQPTIGELVVNERHADDMVWVFEQLWNAGFQIERMELVHHYDSDDDLSMAANNTSAFNCREVAWAPGVWSNHARGTAIDINPLINPYISSTRLLPPEGAPYVDRSLGLDGMIVADDIVVRSFAEIGWTWGGYWNSAKDYQHFDVR